MLRLELVPFIAFGVWLLLVPRSVIRFYSGLSMRAGQVSKSQELLSLRPGVIRAIGLVWLTLLAVFYFK